MAGLFSDINGRPFFGPFSVGFGDGMPVMTLEKWSWFLVQVQNEERLLATRSV